MSNDSPSSSIAKKPRLYVNNTSEVSIEDVLNEDCLEHIFSFLGLIQLVQIERVCKRWQAVSQRCSPKRTFLYLDADDRCYQQAQIFVVTLLSKFGNQLKSVLLVWEARFAPVMLQLIGDICINLEHLNLDLRSNHGRWDRVPPVPEIFLKLVPKLKTLTVSEPPKRYTQVLWDVFKAAEDTEKIVFTNPEISEQDVNKVLVRLPNLEILKLTDYPCKLDPSALQSSSHTLKELYLPDNGLYSEHGIDWPLFPNLKKLNATSVIDNVCIPLDAIEETLDALIGCCPNLEELEMRCSNCIYYRHKKLMFESLPESRTLVLCCCLEMDDGCARFVSDDSNKSIINESQ